MASPEQTGGSRGRTKIFVTVGTTRFDKLVENVTAPSALNWMSGLCGFDELVIQHGRGRPPDAAAVGDPAFVRVRSYDFLPTLEEDMASADLVVSHAGAGTVMEALRLNKKLAVVINADLMDNHQQELADAMAQRGYVFVVDRPDRLLDASTWDAIRRFRPVPYPGGDDASFPRLLRRRFGFGAAAEDDGGSGKEKDA